MMESMLSAHALPPDASPENDSVRIKCLEVLAANETLKGEIADARRRLVDGDTMYERICDERDKLMRKVNQLEVEKEALVSTKYVSLSELRGLRECKSLVPQLRKKIGELELVVQNRVAEVERLSSAQNLHHTLTAQIDALKEELSVAIRQRDEIAKILEASRPALILRASSATQTTKVFSSTDLLTSFRALELECAWKRSELFAESIETLLLFGSSVEESRYANELQLTVSTRAHKKSLSDEIERDVLRRSSRSSSSAACASQARGSLGAVICDDGAGHVVIQAVVPDSAAYNAGLKPGDVIAEIDGVPLCAVDQVHLALRDALGGSRMILGVRPGGFGFPLEDVEVVL
jgi:hypothetical protein